MSTDEKKVEYPKRLEVADVLLNLCRQSDSVPHALELLFGMLDSYRERFGWEDLDTADIDCGVQVEVHNVPLQEYPPGWLLVFDPWPEDVETGDAREVRWYPTESAARVGMVMRYRAWSKYALELSTLPCVEDTRRGSLRLVLWIEETQGSTNWTPRKQE